MCASASVCTGCAYTAGSAVRCAIKSQLEDAPRRPNYRPTRAQIREPIASARDGSDLGASARMPFGHIHGAEDATSVGLVENLAEDLGLNHFRECIWKIPWRLSALFSPFCSKSWSPPPKPGTCVTGSDDDAVVSSQRSAVCRVGEGLLKIVVPSSIYLLRYRSLYTTDSGACPPTKVFTVLLPRCLRRFAMVGRLDCEW